MLDPSGKLKYQYHQYDEGVERFRRWFQFLSFRRQKHFYLSVFGISKIKTTKFIINLLRSRAFCQRWICRGMPNNCVGEQNSNYLLIKAIFALLRSVRYGSTYLKSASAEVIFIVRPHSLIKCAFTWQYNDLYLRFTFFYRAHLNDIENIVPFTLIGLLYLSTLPAPSTAILLFRVFTVARFVFSVVFLMHLQPFRTISFTVGLIVMVYMATASLVWLFNPF